MVLYDIKFKIMFNDDYSILTRKFPSLKVFFWCNNEYDVIEIFVDNPKDYQAVKEHIPCPNNLVEEVSDKNRVHLIVKNCSCCKEENSVVKYVGDLNILHISPVIWRMVGNNTTLLSLNIRILKSSLRELKKRDMN